MEVKIEQKEWHDKEFKKRPRAHCSDERNTVDEPFSKSDKRKRAWFMTLNNYKEKEIDQLISNNLIMKYLFQEEIGEKKGVPHLQGGFYMKDLVSLKWMKEHVNPRCKWLPCDNWFATLNYCSKRFTRNGQIYRKKCRENRKKEESKFSDEEIDNLRREKFNEDVGDIIKDWCWEVGHPLKNCWCKQNILSQFRSAKSPPFGRLGESTNSDPSSAGCLGC